ncbi:hypothetical protein DES37_108243 [Mangrovibacter plantisponsor]|uniref:Uncharacterized protein n=1 Tax=Mangrovibacter plantisponsor TaxID=451513 RepID=A0A317PXH3_9ENTR|nr:hypothetical protein DES37_108243 [Mangrovibacter plantisponsor]
MIIPRAIFLNQTYQKSCIEHRHQVMKEIRQFKSEIVRMLRATENHKLGNIRIEMPCADYPVLTSTGGREHLATIRNEITMAGYDVFFTYTESGDVSFSVDWRMVVNNQ